MGASILSTRLAGHARSSSRSSFNSKQEPGARSSLQNPSPPVISLPQSLLFSLQEECTGTKIFSPFFLPGCSLHK